MLDNLAGEACRRLLMAAYGPFAKWRTAPTTSDDSSGSDGPTVKTALLTQSGHLSDEFRGRRTGGLSNARSNADGLFPATLVRSLVMTGGRPGRQDHCGAPGPRVKPADERNRNQLSEWYDWFADRTSLGLLPSGWDDPGRRRSPRSRGPCLGIAPISRRAARSTRRPSTAGGPRTGT